MFFSPKELNTKNLLWIILMIASVLRLSSLDGFSLSNDELSALARLQFNSLDQIIKEGIYVDFHPAGVHLFLYLWTSLFGFGEWVVRLPFALMGIASVFFLYKVGEKWFGTSTALLAALTLAVLEYPLLYSQIARPYAPGLLFSLMATYFWTRLLFDNNISADSKRSNRLIMAGFVLSVSACMYTHYFSFIFAGILCFTGLFFLKKQNLFPYLLSGLLIVLLYLPHINLFLFQLSKGGVGGSDGWLGPPESDAFVNYLNYCFNDSIQLKSLFAVILIGSFLAFRGKFQLSKFHALTILFFIIPFLIAYFYSIYANPVYQHSVLLFSFPYLLLFIFSFIPKMTGRFTLMIIFYSVMIGGIYSTVVEKKYYSAAHFTEFRGIAQKVKYYDELFGKENITRTISVFNPYYIEYYLNYFNHKTEFKIYTISNTEQKKQFYTIIDNAATPYFEYAFSNIYDPPEFDMIIRSKYPWVIVNDSMMGSGFRLYSNINNDSALNILPFYSFEEHYDQLKDADSFENDSTKRVNNESSVFLNEDMEFGPSTILNTGTIGCNSGTLVELQLSVLAVDHLRSAKLVFTIDRNKETVLWEAASISEFFNNTDKWFNVYLSVNIDIPLDGSEQIKIYCWNEGKEQFYIGKLNIRFYSGR